MGPIDDRAIIENSGMNCSGKIKAGGFNEILVDEASASSFFFFVQFYLFVVDLVDEHGSSLEKYIGRISF